MSPQLNKSPHYHKKCVTICNECDKSFKPGDILTHITDKHCDSYFYKCPLCRDYHGSHMKSLIQHQKDKHQASYFYLSCPLCKFTSPLEKDIEAHLLNAHTKTEDVYFCNYCNVQSKFSLDTHFEKVHSLYVCVFDKCKAVCQSAMDLFRHYINYHFPKLTLYYDCSECDLLFPKENSLYQHMRDKHGMLHEEEGDTSIKFNCKKCVFGTFDKGTYQEHVNNYHSNDFFNCTFQNCDYTTNRFWSIIQHTIDKHLSYSFFRYFCFVCEEISYPKINSLIQHLRDKHSIEDYCTYCNSYEDDLLDHILSDPDHSDRYYCCNLCNDEFDEKDELVDHISDNHVNIIPLLKSLCYGC